jgi:hypothetical protein
LVRARIDRQRGGALIVVAAVVMLMVLAVFAKWTLLDIERKLTQQTGVGTTLSKIDTALANFVAQNKRLPCPADGTIASGVLNAGVETISPGPLPAKGTCNPATQINGVVPWVTLGLAESEASDPWNGRITYRVFPPLAMQAQAIAPSPIAPVPAPYGLMDMSACDPSGTSIAPVPITGLCGGFSTVTICTQCAPSVVPCNAANLGNCVSPAHYLLNKGIVVQDGNGTFLNNPATGTGAAYVLISHGSTGAGAYNKNGANGPLFSTQPGGIPAGTNEIQNSNNRTLTGNIFMDAQPNAAAGLTHFDDYLSHPTITTVLTSANLGPRAH